MRMTSLSTTSVVRACGAAASLACCAGAAHATAFSWATGVSANWNTSARWTPTGVPSSSADTASITVAPAPTPYTVTVSNGFTLGGLTLDQPQATLVIGAGGQLAMASGAAVNLAAGKLSINGGSLAQAGAGTFTMAPGSTLETFSNVTMPAGMAYTLGGAIVMDGTLQGFPAAGWTNGGSITLTGPALSWLFSTGPLTNNGMITADTAGGGRRIQAPITNSATGSIIMNADTEWRSGPHSNSGTVKIALFKTFTMGSFATVNQNAGNFIVAGSYTHTNGAFNMNGGALTAQQSFLKDGGSFSYNGGTIDGAPTLHNALLTLSPVATNAASFVARGPNTTVSGEIKPSCSILVEATASEIGSLSGGGGDLINRGTITMAPTPEQQARLTSAGGSLFNHGTITGPTPTDGAIDAGVVALFLSMTNFDEGSMELTGSAAWFLDKLQGGHKNRGVITLSAGSPKVPSASMTIKAGSQATFTQEAGAIHNGGAFVVEQGCTFEFAGGQCTGEPIKCDGATLEIDPGAAGACSFELIGPGNTIVCDALGDGQSICIGPDDGRDCEATWEVKNRPQDPPEVEGGSVCLAPSGSFDATLFLPDGLDLDAGGELRVEASGGEGAAHILGVPTDTLFIDGFSGDPATLNSFGPLDTQLSVSVDYGAINATIWWGDSTGASAPRGASAFASISVGGDYSQGANGALRLGIAGLLAGAEHDVVAIAGAASLDGELEIALTNGFQPEWGDAFTIMTFASRTGDFASFTPPTLADASLRWWRNARADIYLVGVRHVADTNHDGVVDFLDLNNVLSYFGMPAPPGSAAAIGDANTDGVVDFLDLNQVLGAFGTSAP